MSSSSLPAASASRRHDPEHRPIRRGGDIAGNHEFKQYINDAIRGVRLDGRRTGFNLLLTGDKRSGKTSGVTYLLQCLGCFGLDFGTLAACGRCENCRFQHHVTGNAGWEDLDAYIQQGRTGPEVRYHLSIVNGPALRPESVTKLIERVERVGEMLTVVYLDEFFRTDSRVMEALLAPMDRAKAIWIATSVPRKTTRTGRAESEEEVRIREMAVERFTYRIRTELPSPQEMKSWLRDRCDEFGIGGDDPDDALPYLAERSRYIPGSALKVLTKAFNRPGRKLTRRLIDDHFREAW